MPLLCISLLALLLLPLPLALSCDTELSKELKENMEIILTDLGNTNKSITSKLQNSTCTTLTQKLPRCMHDNKDVVKTLHEQTCMMKKINIRLNITETNRVVRYILNTLRCLCKSTTGKLKTVTRQKRDEHGKRQKWTNRLCKTEAILSAMTTCIQKTISDPGPSPSS